MKHYTSFRTSSRKQESNNKESISSIKTFLLWKVLYIKIHIYGIYFFIKVWQAALMRKQRFCKLSVLPPITFCFAQIPIYVSRKLAQRNRLNKSQQRTRKRRKYRKPGHIVSRYLKKYTLVHLFLVHSRNNTHCPVNIFTVKRDICLLFSL